MALLEGPPVIAEELREGVFVDPLPGGCHSARLYHGLGPRSTRLCPSSAPLSPSSLPIATGGEGILKKRKFLYSPFALSIANIVNFKLPVERRPQPQPTQD